MRHYPDKEFRRRDTIASIIRRATPFFTSNHAAFIAPQIMKYRSPRVRA
ncbi:MAG: hypothetical protein RBS58_02560 [Syntrophales bacterium]|nr:hypothetical protein [Syntrophales bacterium]MDX9921534.1 hypothetical protein [Syntrophales bacterium]